MNKSSNVQKLLNGVKEEVYRKNRLKHEQSGKIHFKTALAQGKFKKVAWDLYEKVESPDAGSIWTVADIEGDQWLVVYTDENDHIVRGLTAEVESRMQKTASTKKEAIETLPGDICRVNAEAGSINAKYNNAEGEVIAAYPERSQLIFQDDYTMWFENKDLDLVREANILVNGDMVRLRKNTRVMGQVNVINGNAITFKSPSGQTFSARASELEKITKSGQTIVLWTEDPKAIKYLVPGQQGGSAPIPGSENNVPPPPSIKANPPAEEMNKGTSMPARDAVPPTVQQMADSEILRSLYGRILNINDTVLNKESGLEGTIKAVDVDRKFGKYYLVDYGTGTPVREFETNLMKTNPKTIRAENPPFDPGSLLESKFKEHGLKKEAQDVPGMETLRGGGGGGANVAPLTWEVSNEGSEKDKAKDNMLNDALNEQLEAPDMEMSGDTIDISIDPKSKKITIDFGGETETEMPAENVQTAPPPGSPAGGTAQMPGGNAQTQFGQQDIGVEF